MKVLVTEVDKSGASNGGMVESRFPTVQENEGSQRYLLEVLHVPLTYLVPADLRLDENKRRGQNRMGKLK